MRMKASRSLWLGVTVALAQVLAGCTAAGAPPASSAPGSTAAGAGKETVTITYSTFQLADPVAGPEYKRQIAAFEKDNPGIKVETEAPPLAQYPAKIAAAAKAGEAPDLVSPDLAWIQGWIDQGYLLDLTPSVNEVGGKSYLDNFYGKLVELGSKDGKPYGLPRFAGGYVLQYNKDLFKEAGLDPARPPTTWDELLADARKLTKKDASGNTVQWGIGLHGQNITADVSRFVNWMYANGAEVLSSDGKSAQLDQPKAIETLKFWSGLYTSEGVVPPGAVQNGPGQVRSLFAQKKIAMMLSIVWGVDLVLAENPSLKDSIALAPFPRNVPNAPSNFQAVYDAVSASSKHPQEAWKLLEYFERPENQLALYKASHYAPTRSSVLKSPELRDDPYARVLDEVNQNLKPLPTIPQWEQVSNIIGDAMQQALNGTKTPEDAFKEANTRVDQILK